MNTHAQNIKELQKKTKNELIEEIIKLREKKLDLCNLPFVSNDESKEFYELIFHNSHCGILITDENYKTTFANKSFCEILEISNSNLEDFVLPESFLEIAKNVKTYGNIEDIDLFENISLKLNDSNIKELEINCITFQSQNEKLKLVFQIKDNTYDKLSSEEVKYSEKRFETIVENSYNGIVIIDENFKIEYVNKSMLKLSSLNENDFIGKKLVTFIDEDYLEKVKQISRNIKTPQQIELKLNFANKKKIFARITASVLDFKDSIKTIAQLVDITEDVNERNLQTVLLNISQAVNVVDSLPEFISIVREELSKIIDTKNFSVALYDKRSNVYEFPYYIDEIDTVFEKEDLSNTLTDYVRRKNKAILVDRKVSKILIEQGEILESKTITCLPVWLGAPLVVDKEVVGVIAIQNHHYEKAYDQHDLELLKLIAQNVSSAIWKKQAIDKLTESELRYRDFISKSSEAIYRVDFTKPIDISLPINEQVKMMLHTASIEECNDAFAKMYGFTNTEELIGRKLMDFYPKENYSDIFNEHLNLVKNNYHLSDIETYEYNSKGEKLIVSNTTTGIIKNGFLHNIWGIQKNLTASKRIQNIVKEVAEGIYSLTGDSFFKSLVNLLKNKLKVEYAFIAEIAKNLETGRIVASCDHLVNLDNYLFKTIETPCNTAIKHHHPHLVDNLLEKYPNISFFQQNKLNNYLGQALFDSNGKVIGVLVILNKKRFDDIDFTKSVLKIFAVRSAAELERKNYLSELIEAKEEAVKSNNLKSNFLAQMSHEIRTPVNTILSFTSLLKESMEDKVETELKDAFNIIENGGRRLIRTIDLILSVSQIQSGSLQINLEKINVIKILEDLVLEFEQRAYKKNLTISLETKFEKLNIIADQYTVTQIFANLIHNAIKYTNKGKISVRAFKDEKNEILVQIADTGVGMGPEFLTKIFEPFSQEETGYTRKFEGTGLGLTLVKNYCDLNQAMINVQSKKNEGSTFTITFKHNNS